jgi:hypothetical protein
MVFDSQRAMIVLFDGFDANDPGYDTWEWNGTTWTMLPITGPTARGYTAMTFDAVRGVTVLFGGGGDGTANDTWTFDGTSWTEQFPGNSPLAREEHGMAFDAAHGVTVLFGGTNDGTNGLNDTWLWNGTNWVQPAPVAMVPPRSDTAMVFDSARSISVLFGGVDGSGNLLADTWEWNGAVWTQSSATGPAGRSDHNMAYDSNRNLTVLFGGVSSGVVQNDTWEFDGTSWTQQDPPNVPPAREQAAMTFDSAHGVTLLFGGSSGTSPMNDTWEWTGSDWTQSFPSDAPSSRSNAAMVYVPIGDVAFLFGGLDGTSTPLNDTWVWNGTNWIQLSPAASPPARYGHGLAYDATLGQVVLFGGYAGGTGLPLNDTWAFNGSNWTQLAPITSAPGMLSFAMSYDAARGATTIFGGSNGTTVSGGMFVFPSGTAFVPANIAEFDFLASGESLSSVTLEELSVSASAGGTGYANPGPIGGGTAASGAVLTGWSSAVPGAWRVLNTNAAGTATAMSYTTASASEARSYSVAGPWETFDFALFPTQTTGNGAGPGTLAVMDPELTVQYIHQESSCNATDGGCLCASDETQCGTVCADIAIDPQNCGGCAGSDGGTSCTGGMWCVAGSCACPPGEQLCNGACTDTMTDPNNCGACNGADGGTVCGPLATCTVGTCTAPTGCTPESCLTSDAGPSVCNVTTGQCAQCNTNADCACTLGIASPSSCPVPAQLYCNPTGACVQCLSDGDCTNGICIGGFCQSCPDAGTDLEIGCSGVCTNTANDSKNCGGCGYACNAGYGCSFGRCYAP